MPTVSRGTFYPLVSGVAVLEDFADRLSHVWSFWLFIVFACVLTWRQQSFNLPIVCWTPAEFRDNQVAYAHATCWASYAHRKYSLENSFKIEPMPQSFIWSYKWLPVVLVIQALLFKLPNFILHVLHGYSGVSFEKIAGLTKGYENLNLMERSYLGKQAGRYLYNWCKMSGSCLPMRFLSLVWLLVKILFCANVTTQFVLLDAMLSTHNPPFDNSTSYGDVIYANLFNKSSTVWKTSPIFPRRVRCSYDVRQLRNVYQYDVQCDLPINEFSEHLYMVVWAWLLIVAVVSCTSLAVWLVRAIVPIGRERYISRMLQLSYELNAQQLTRSDVTKLADLAGEDGVLVLKLLSFNSSELLVRDAVTTMFQMNHPHLQPSHFAQAAAAAPAPAFSEHAQGQTQPTAHAPEKP